MLLLLLFSPLLQWWAIWAESLEGHNFLILLLCFHFPCLFTIYPFLSLIFQLPSMQFHIQLFVYCILQQLCAVLYSVAVVNPFCLSFHRSLSHCLRPGFPRQPSLSPLVLPMEPPPPPQHSAKHHNYPAAGKKQRLWFMLVPHSHEQTALDVFILYVIKVTEQPSRKCKEGGIGREREREAKIAC